jgi:hypothetical protein
MNVNNMQKNFKLIVNRACEVYDLVKPYADGEFDDIERDRVHPGAVYLIGRPWMEQNNQRVRDLIDQHNITVVFSNPWEGSTTMHGQLIRYKIQDLAESGKILLLTGGDMEPYFHYHKFDRFASDILQYSENFESIKRTPEIFEKTEKPYKFLFLNGRYRQHRKWMLARLRMAGLLEQSLYTCLSIMGSTGPTRLPLIHNGENLMDRVEPIKVLDPYYEVDRYASRTQTKLSLNEQENYAKYDLFNQEWGEIYIKPEPYIDTYFSLVTETVYESRHSFFTEKIWKPIMMGHPWIAVANHGFYKDLRDLGFKTFDSLIDESFDEISNPHSRLTRQAQVIEDLCRQDLKSFLAESRSICEHNQQHLLEYGQRVSREFPQQFMNFISKNVRS